MVKTQKNKPKPLSKQWPDKQWIFCHPCRKQFGGKHKRCPVCKSEEIEQVDLSDVIKVTR